MQAAQQSAGPPTGDLVHLILAEITHQRPAVADACVLSPSVYRSKLALDRRQHAVLKSQFTPAIRASLCAKRSPGSVRPGALQCAYCCRGGTNPTARAAGAAAWITGISPVKAAHSSPHIQSELVTDHLHFSGHAATAAIQVMPSRHGHSSGVTASRFGKRLASPPGLIGLSKTPYWPTAGLFRPKTPFRTPCVPR
jgi:hypothetical protein